MIPDIKRVYARLLRIGLSENAQFKEKIRVELSNQFIVVGLTCVLLHNVVNLFFLHSLVDFCLTMVWFAVLAGGLLFNLSHKTFIARLVLAFGGVIAVFSLHILFGAGLKLESMYILFLVVAALFFEFSLMVKCAFMIVSFVILATIINSHFQPPFEELVNPNGAFTRFVFSVTIIASLIGKLIMENRRYNSVITNQNGELKNYNQQLKSFNYIVSHDLKEPLRSIVGFSQLIKRNFDKGANVEEDHLDHIIHSTKQLNKLVDDLKDFTNSGERDISNEIFKIDDLVQEIVLSSSKLINENKAEVHCASFPPIFASKVALTIILQNLIENGIKYNKHTHPQVSIDGEIDKGMAKVRIVDNGMGIEEEYFEKIFELFQSLNAGYNRGSGLGLNIAKRLLRRIEGEIFIVKSEINRGTTFQINFPAEIRA